MSYPGNNNCDNDKCIHKHGPVRRLPTSKVPHGGAVILCHHCFGIEMAFRRERNKELEKDCQFDIPNWTDLELYTGA